MEAGTRDAFLEILSGHKRRNHSLTSGLDGLLSSSVLALDGDRSGLGGGVVDEDTIGRE